MLSFTLNAWNKALPDGDPLFTELSADVGDFNLVEGPSNHWAGQGEWETPADEGEYTLKAVYNFSDESICIAFTVVTVSSYY